jgi:hypothetical protein
LQAYYGGALTMFFTIPLRVYFGDSRDAINSYPRWKMVILKGDFFGRIEYIFGISRIRCRISPNCIMAPLDTEALYKLLGESEPVYANYLERVLAKPDKFFFSSIDEGLKMLRDGRTVMHINSQILKSHLR